jgi:hypothetical protein
VDFSGVDRKGANALFNRTSKEAKLLLSSDVNTQSGCVSHAGFVLLSGFIAVLNNLRGERTYEARVYTPNPMFIT